MTDAPLEPPQESPEPWVAVTEAARVTALPVRTVYRWIKSGTLRSKIEGASKLVDIGELRELAQKRAASGAATVVVPAAAGSVPARGHGGVSPAQPVDGEIAGRLFQRFDGGVEPADVVMEEHLSPAMVMAVYAQWRQLRQLPTGKSEPRLVDIVKTVVKEVADLRKAVLKASGDAIDEYSRSVAARHEQREALEAMTAEVGAMRQAHQELLAQSRQLARLLTWIDDLRALKVEISNLRLEQGGLASKLASPLYWPRSDR